MAFYAGAGSWQLNKSALFPCGVLTPTTNDSPASTPWTASNHSVFWSIPFQAHRPHGHFRLHGQMSFVRDGRWPSFLIFPATTGLTGQTY